MDHRSREEWTRAIERLSAFCEQRVPEAVRDQVRLEWRRGESSLTLVERRPRLRRPWEWTESDVAMFRFDGTEMVWTLYCRDRDGRWHRFPGCSDVRDFDELIDEVDTDRTGIFWG